MAITINNNHSLTMKGSGKVSISSLIQIAGTSTSLPITVTADFGDIPEEYHEIYFQAFVYQYQSGVIVHSNTGKSKACEKKSNIDKIIELVCNPKNWIIKKK